MMSTDYTQTLKSIKEAEEASNAAIAERKRQLEERLRSAEEDSARSLAEARKKAEELIAAEVERARLSAQSNAEKLLASTSKDAAKIAAKRLSPIELRKIIDETLLSEFKGA